MIGPWSFLLTVISVAIVVVLAFILYPVIGAWYYLIGVGLGFAAGWYGEVLDERADRKRTRGY